MILSLCTVISLFLRVTNAQLPDQGNAVEFPSSFGVAGGLLSGMLGFVDMFDTSFGPSPSPPRSGFAPTDSPSSLQGSTSAGRVPFTSDWSFLNQSRPDSNNLNSTTSMSQGTGRSSSQPNTEVVDTVSHAPDNIPKNDIEGIAVTVPFDMFTRDVTSPLLRRRRSPPPFNMSPPEGARPLQPISRGHPPSDITPSDGANPLQPISRDLPALDMTTPSAGKQFQPNPRGLPPFDTTTKNENKPLQPIPGDVSPLDISRPSVIKPLQPIIKGPPPFDMSPRDGAKPLQPIPMDPPAMEISTPDGAKPLQPIPRGPPPFDMSSKDGAKPLKPIQGDLATPDISPPDGSKPLQPMTRGPPPFDMSPKDGAKPLKPIQGDLATPGISPPDGSKPLKPIPKGPPPFDMSPKDGAKPLQPMPIVPPTFDISLSKNPSQSDAPPLDKTIPLGVTQKPKTRDPIFIDKTSLGRTHSIGPTGADSSQSVNKNANAKDVQSVGQSLATNAFKGSSFSGLVEPLTDIFGGLPAQRRDSLANTSVIIIQQQSNNAPVMTGSQQIIPVVRPSTTKATTTIFPTSTKRSVLPTAPPASNQEILQLLNTFSSRRIVLGKSQGYVLRSVVKRRMKGKPQEPQRSNSPPVQMMNLNNNQGNLQEPPRSNSPPVQMMNLNNNQGNLQEPPRSNSPPVQMMNLNNNQGNLQEPPRSNSPPVQMMNLNNNQGQTLIGGQNSVPVSSLSADRGGNLNRIQSQALSGPINSGQGRAQIQNQGQSQGRVVQSPSGNSQQVVVSGLGVIDFDPGASDPTGWTNILLGLLHRL